MSTLPVPPGQPRLFSSNKNSIRMSEQDCFVVRATNRERGWSNPVYYQTTEMWTCYVTKATLFTDYDAALAMVEELRRRPPQLPTGKSLLVRGTLLDAVPLMGQMHRNKDNGFRKK